MSLSLLSLSSTWAFYSRALFLINEPSGSCFECYISQEPFILIACIHTTWYSCTVLVPVCSWSLALSTLNDSVKFIKLISRINILNATRAVHVETGVYNGSVSKPKLLKFTTTILTTEKILECVHVITYFESHYVCFTFTAVQDGEKKGERERERERERLVGAIRLWDNRTMNREAESIKMTAFQIAHSPCGRQHSLSLSLSLARTHTFSISHSLFLNSVRRFKLLSTPILTKLLFCCISLTYLTFFLRFLYLLSHSLSHSLVLSLSFSFIISFL